MNHLHRCGLAVVLLLAFATNLRAAEQTYYLPYNGHLHVNVPDGWKASYEPAKGSWDQPTVRLERDDAVLTFVPLKADGAAIPGDEEVKLLTTNATTSFWKRSTDKNFNQDEMRAGDVYGRFSYYTIAKPTADERPNVTVGVVRIGRVVITTTLQYTGADSPAKEAGLAIVKSLRLDVATPLKQTTFDASYVLMVDGDWKAAEPVVDATKKAITVTGADELRGWQVTVNLDPSQPKQVITNDGADHDLARAYFLGQLKAAGQKIGAVKESTVAYCSVAEWNVGDEKHALSGYAADSTWIAVHLVKPKFDEKTDQATLDELLNGITATRLAPPALPGKKKMGKK